MLLSISVFVFFSSVFELSYGIVCVINKTLPPYQPNIYLCDGEAVQCCKVYGQNACCELDLTSRELQSTMPLCFFIFFIMIALISWCYFHDVDPMVAGDGEKFNDKPTLTNYLFPNDESYKVEDPILALPSEEKAPTYADPWKQEGDDNEPNQNTRQRKKNQN